LIDMFLDLFYR